MGVMDWMNDDGEDGEANELSGFDDGMDELDGGMDGLGDGDGDEFDEGDAFGDGLDDDLGEGFGGDGLDDDFGGDPESNKTAELEDRIGEMENQVSSLSSEMNTVRQENIQIGDTVDELDDTIRKLLDIYEMVTRGINPFVDDAREMGGIDGGNGAFGLFDTEEETESENLDNDVVGADADSFFDDDLGELDAAAGEQEAEIAAEDELSEEERDAAPGLDDDTGPAADDDAGGASFDDLKAEYESGDGEWTDDGEANADAETETEADADPIDAFDDAADPAAETEAFDDAADEESSDAHLDDAANPAADAEAHHEGERPDGDSNPDGASASGDDATEGTGDTADPDLGGGVTASARTDGEDGDADAYLASLPPSYVAETLLLEWADYLVSEGGARNAVRAVRQYREFGWLSARAADDFEEYVVGTADASSPAGGDVLTVDHHATSLSYVVRLAGDSPGLELELEPRVRDDLTALLGGEGSGLRG